MIKLTYEEAMTHLKTNNTPLVLRSKGNNHQLIFPVASRFCLLQSETSNDFLRCDLWLLSRSGEYYAIDNDDQKVIDDIIRDRTKAESGRQELIDRLSDKAISALNSLSTDKLTKLEHGPILRLIN